MTIINLNDRRFFSVKRLSSNDLTQIALSAALLAVSSLIVIPVGVVPITLQVFFFFFLPALLGPIKGIMVVALYLFMGLVGLPVFAGGTGGLMSVLSPSFGYLLGALAVAWIVGKTFLKQRSLLYKSAVMTVALLLLYAVGMSYQYLIMNYVLSTPLSLNSILTINLTVFLPIDLVKLVFAFGLYERLKKLPFARRIDKLVT
ncbi:MAG: biotin transporter BioY [Alkalibacterium sp.]|nr:MAG: biotin transporter BioY [Alkalibacterium sp.]